LARRAPQAEVGIDGARGADRGHQQQVRTMRGIRDRTREIDAVARARSRNSIC